MIDMPRSKILEDNFQVSIDRFSGKIQPLSRTTTCGNVQNAGKLKNDTREQVLVPGITLSASLDQSLSLSPWDAVHPKMALIQMRSLQGGSRVRTM